MIIIKGPGQLIARGLPAERAAPLISSNAIKSGEKNQNRIFVQIFAQIFVQIPSNQVRRIITNRMTALSVHFTFISHVFGFHFYFLQGELHPPSNIWELFLIVIFSFLFHFYFTGFWFLLLIFTGWATPPISALRTTQKQPRYPTLSGPTSGLFLSLKFEVSKSTFILLIIWGLLLSLSLFEVSSLSGPFIL